MGNTISVTDLALYVMQNIEISSQQLHVGGPGARSSRQLDEQGCSSMPASSHAVLPAHGAGMKRSVTSCMAPEGALRCCAGSQGSCGGTRLSKSQRLSWARRAQ